MYIVHSVNVPENAECRYLKGYQTYQENYNFSRKRLVNFERKDKQQNGRNVHSNLRLFGDLFLIRSINTIRCLPF